MDLVKICDFGTDSKFYMGAGLHGKNGLNPTTCLHLLQVYVILILTYGLEILLPSRTELQTLEIFLSKNTKADTFNPNKYSRSSRLHPGRCDTDRKPDT